MLTTMGTQVLEHAPPWLHSNINLTFLFLCSFNILFQCLLVCIVSSEKSDLEFCIYSFISSAYSDNFIFPSDLDTFLFLV